MSNHIHDIEIKNFKSIRHLKIEDCRRVNVFIGYPNVGKSNILEAIGFLTYIRHKDRPFVEQLVRIEKVTQLFHFYNIHEPSKVRFNDRYSLSIQYKDEKLVGFHLKDDTEELSSYFEAIASMAFEAGISSLSQSSTNNVDDFAGRLKTVQSFNIKPFKFSSGNKFDESYSALELKVPYGENMFEVIASSNVLKAQFTDLLKEYNLRMVVNVGDNTISILLPQSTRDVIYTIPFSLLADTLIRLIFFKTAIHSNKDSILLFEEPEAHMFPPYIGKFMGDIMYDENNNQYFIATHSPFVLNDFMEDLEADDLSIYAVGYKNETGETIIRRLTDEEITEIYQYGIDLFFNLENFLKDAV